MQKLTYETLVAALSTMPGSVLAGHNGGGAANGNGHVSTERKTGSDQAASRMNEQGKPPFEVQKPEEAQT